MNSFKLPPQAVEAFARMLRSYRDEQPASASKPVLMLPQNGKGITQSLTFATPSGASGERKEA